MGNWAAKLALMKSFVADLSISNRVIYPKEKRVFCQRTFIRGTGL